jgi:flagellar biogenesis protein FliO
MVGGLAIVLGLFFFAAWFTRRTQPQSAALLPAEVVQSLGRAPLNGRQQMHLVRFGGKLLLVSVSPSGAETLSEITDPAEVDRLAGVCQQNRPGSITTSFRQALHQLGGTPASADFVGEAGQSQVDLANDVRESRSTTALSRSQT